MNGSGLLLYIDALGFVTAKYLLSLSWQFLVLFAAA